ncbi:hypothetical protein BDV96DRAFT_487784 [Lophiotrema nucula]|uniref:NAD(P)-binding domain-containing protein n=1 Tax=Lophiotrema nucula TaxID=690887 RepID=A0A6A5ZI33_9PLEO|nr:hypothetical protein BDV96DRAFT_487784 [Lophiotrema nucula]
MATYAVLGATGNCGTALIENILRKEDAQLKAYCRNERKLISRIPQLNDNKRVQIYEGSIYDTDLLAECIRDTRAVFHVVTTNDNVPGCRIGLDAAKSIVAALEKIRHTLPASTDLPKIVLLSSSTIDDHLSRHMSRFFRSILLKSASSVYEDLRQTEAFLRTHEDWVTTIFMKPGGLSCDIQRGHQLHLDQDESFISYLDLAAGMIEAVDDLEGRYDMQNVSIINTNGSAAFPRGTPMCIVVGLLRHFFPFLHTYLPSTGP